MVNRDEQGRWLERAHPGPGRKSEYAPILDRAAFQLALLGLSNQEMADCFNISIQTFHSWTERHPSFLEAINKGRLPADGEVAASLYRRAIGMTVRKERSFFVPSEGGEEKKQVIEVTLTEISPDTHAEEVRCVCCGIHPYN